MCGRFDTSHLTWEEIYDQLSKFGTVRATNIGVEPSEDVRPTTQQITVRRENGEFVAETMRWGLVPFFWNGKRLKPSARGAGDGWKPNTINAKIETCAGTGSFREAFKRRRCIIPAMAWYEWTGPEGSKTKHRFARQDGRPMWFAGMWDRVNTIDAGEFASFTIATTESEGWLQEFHTRAPIIIEPDEWDVWLDPASDAADILGVRPDRFKTAVAA